ncbi:MAG: hypothetical protein ACI8PZ_004858 [Myxococcota bacterium]|jgi:hypothetical protein
MNRIMLTALAIASLPACVVYVDEPVDTGRPYVEEVVVVVEQVNYAPEVLSADAFVYYEPAYADDIWAFEAVVDDLDGPYDVVSVWADVYDEYAGGAWVGSFELYPTNDPYLWYSDWLGRSTYLDPFYGGYTVDLVAYDVYDAYGYQTIWATTYAY